MPYLFVFAAPEWATPPLTSFAAWRARMQTSTGNRTCNGGRLYRNFNNIRVRSFILTGAPAISIIYAWRAVLNQKLERCLER